jgi:hypothetical protein
MTTNNLTEQWKKGELPTGDYYVKPKNGQVFVYHINHSVKHIYHNHAGEIKEVLAPVPSYEEWQQMKAFCEEFNALKVAEENQQLKELLIECREWIEFMEEKSRVDENYKGTMYFKNLLTKIDEVLK